MRLAELRVAEDRRLGLAHARRAVVVLEHARPGQQRGERHVERERDRPQHAERRLVHPALELAEVGVRHAGALRQVAQRQPAAIRCERRSRPSASSDAFHESSVTRDIFADGRGRRAR